MSTRTEQAIIVAYMSTYLDLRGRVAASIGALWANYGGLDDVDAARFSTLASGAVTTTQRQMVSVVDGYMDALARESGRSDLLDAPRLNPSNHIGANVRVGADPLEVYTRPIITARTELGNGSTWQEAMDRAERRAVTQAQTDLALTNRSAAQGAMEVRNIRFYRRVLTGESCVFCAVASTQRYKRGDLMPLHDNCDCGIAPILTDRDPGRILNEELLDALKDGNVPNYWKQKGVVTNEDGQFVIETRTGRRVVETKVVQHGEKGPTLIDARHKPTLPGQLPPGPRPGLPPGPRPTPPAAPAPTGPIPPGPRPLPPGPRPTPTPRPAPPIPPGPRPLPPGPRPAPPAAPAASARRGRAPQASDLDVQREAARKGISADQVLALREATRIRRLNEQKLARQAVKDFNTSNPKVIAAAREAGITPDELVTARLQLDELRRQVREAAAASQAEAFSELYRINVPKIRGPLKSDFGPGGSGQYDWFTGLDEREKARLSRSFFQRGSTVTPDQLAQVMEEVGYRFSTLDEAMAIWLDITRRYEAAGALARGRLPSPRAYSNSNAARIDNIAARVAADGYDVRAIMSDDLINGAAHVATKVTDEIAEEALRYLGDAPAARYGPRPYQMRYDVWRGEVEDLEFLVRNQVSDMTIEELGRLRELIPPDLDSPGASYAELYARIIDTARTARQRVIANVDIPWGS